MGPSKARHALMDYWPYHGSSEAAMNGVDLTEHQMSMVSIGHAKVAKEQLKPGAFVP